MKIEIYGPGCWKCTELEKRAREAVEAGGLQATVEHEYDMFKMIQRGIFMTPALLVDGKTVVAGRIPTVEEIGALLGG